AKAATWTIADAQARKRGEQKGLDTPVVHALNVCRLRTTVARLKLKGIDGGPHKRWSMWLNSMQREEPYLALTCIRQTLKGVLPSGLVHRCCMAVVSSCREMLR
ncbi:unnamed protein product, partial [Phaeothamnion confervicola]